MSGDLRRVADYLSHGGEAIERVRRYADGLDKTTFLRSEIVQDAVIRNFEIIGEACRNIERNDPTFASIHPELPLTSAYEMRSALPHAYFRVDLEVV